MVRHVTQAMSPTWIKARLWLIALMTVVAVLPFYVFIQMAGPSSSPHQCVLHAMSAEGASQWLDLRHCELESVPKGLHTMTSLRVLDLSHNNLMSLPEGLLDNLPNLQVLFLSSNNFAQVPSLSSLNSLHTIALKHNQLTHVDAASLPSSLEALILTGNRITSVVNLPRLKNLRKIMLAHNQLESLPPGLHLCTRLEVLRLAANRITRPPFEVAQLPNLAWLALGGNPYATRHRGQFHEGLGSIDMAAVSLQRKLDEGAGGVVWQGLYQGQKVAVKLLHKSGSGSDGAAVDEVRMNARLTHPAIIKVVGVSYQPLAMVMEWLPDPQALANRPSLDSKTRDTPRNSVRILSSAEVKQALVAVADVLAYLHSQGVCHGDLYLHNVVVARDMSPRVSDFGASFDYSAMQAPSSEVSLWEQIEVRAFGILMQDLMEFNDVRADDTMSALIRDCTRPDVQQRPGFVHVKEVLQTASVLASGR